MRRVLISVILIVSALIGCTGCKSDKSKSVNDLALEHMEKKYGKKFEYKQPAGNSMTGTRNFIASCSHGHVLVQIDNYEDKNARVFRDNHIAVKYEQETRDFIQEIVNKTFPESKLYYGAAEKALSADLPGDATLEQFLADPESRIWADIMVKQSDYSDNEQLKSVLREIFEHCAGNWFQVHIYVIETDDLDSYDKTMFEKTVRANNYIKSANLRRQDDKTELVIHSRGDVLDEKIEY